MKRKVLAIALSLALLSSLLAFAVPAIADAGRNVKCWDVSFSSLRTGYPTGQSGNFHWLGGLVSVTLPEYEGGPDETRDLDYGIRLLWPWTAWGDIEGDFGPFGHLSGRFDYQCWATYDWFEGNIRSIYISEYKFYSQYDPTKPPEEWGGLKGTFTLKIEGEAEMLWWRVADPTSNPFQTRYAGERVFTSISGTGIFENVSLNGTGEMVYPYDQQLFIHEGTMCLDNGKQPR